MTTEAQSFDIEINDQNADCGAKGIFGSSMS